MLQLIQKAITTIFGLPCTISERKSKRLSHKKFTPPYTANKSLSPKGLWNKARVRLWFKERCLKQENKALFSPNNVINLFIVYWLGRWTRDLSTDFTLTDCLFGAVKLTKNADRDKYKYSGYDKGFTLCSEISLSDGSMGKM